MDVIDAAWNEMNGYTNNPRMEMLVSGKPSLSDMDFREIDLGRKNLYVGEASGYVRFFAHSGDDTNEGGFGGTSYTLNMEDGSTKVLRGPYSSRAGVVNKYTDMEVVKIVSTDDADRWNRGGANRTAHYTLAVAEKCVEITGMDIEVEERSSGEYYHRFV